MHKYIVRDICVHMCKYTIPRKNGGLDLPGIPYQYTYMHQMGFLSRLVACLVYRT